MRHIRWKKCLVSIVCAALLLHALAFSCRAIDFDAEETYNAVFVVYSGDYLGSGFAVGENCIISNAHVIADVDDIQIQTYAGDYYKASVVDMDEALDIVVLKVDGAKFPCLTVGDLSQMHAGDDVYTIGAPNAMSYTLTKGIISAMERPVGRYKYIQIDAAINSGNSGGPLLNSSGQVIGVNTMKISDSEGIGLSIPITAVCDYLTSCGIELTDSGNVSGPVTADSSQSPSPGVTASPVSPGTVTSEKSSVFSVTTLLLVLLILSFGLNVYFIIRAVYHRKRPPAVPPVSPDPSERTDFDIDLWE